MRSSLPLQDCGSPRMRPRSKAPPLPPDIDPVTLTRLPQLTRADLDDEGKAIYDKIVGDGPVPANGPGVGVALQPEDRGATKASGSGSTGLAAGSHEKNISSELHLSC